VPLLGAAAHGIKTTAVANRLPWAAAAALLYALHQDLWFWDTARPLAAGFLPVGLTYHALYCLAAAGLLWALTTFTWPAHLDPAGEPAPPSRDPQR
jgi:hypothetical protein